MSPTTQQPPRRNVVLVVLDTVRKDYFDVYAPRIQRRAGTSFSQCRAASCWSVPSHASMLTGMLPHRHGAHAERFDSNFSFADIPYEETFLDDLEGYETVGLSTNAYVNGRFDFDDFFDDFYDFSIGSHTAESLYPEGLTVQEYIHRTEGATTVEKYLGFLGACLEHDHTTKSLANGVWSQVGPHYKESPLPEFVDDGADVLSRTALDHVDDGEEPFFLFMNFMDAHTPLRPLLQYAGSLHSVPNDWSSTRLDKWELNVQDRGDEEYARNYRATYGAAIDYLDRAVASLADQLRRRTDRETTIVVVSDHGHNLGYPADDGMFHHTSSMTEAVMHTPCEILNPPPGAPEEVSGYFSQTELGALLVQLAEGRSSFDDLTDQRIVAETIGLLGTGDGTWGREFESSEYAYWNRMVRCLYEDGSKVEWSSLGDATEYRLDPARPSWQRQVATDVDVPETPFFDVDLDTYKRQASRGESEYDFEGVVENQLRDLGYL